MMIKLESGSAFEYSYANICPHKNKADCKCIKMKNILIDGHMMREVSPGVLKPVIPESLFRDIYSHMANKE